MIWSLAFCIIPLAVSGRYPFVAMFCFIVVRIICFVMQIYLHRSFHPLICLLVKNLSGIGEIGIVVQWPVEWVPVTQWPLWLPRNDCCLSNTRRCLSAGGHNTVIGLWLPLILYGGVDNLTILCINLISDIMCFNIQKAIVLTTWNIIMSRFVFYVLHDVVFSF